MDGASQPTEQGGVLHVVHGWIQQAQPEKVSGPYVSSYICWLLQGLFISGNITVLSSSVAAAGSYFALIEAVARTVALTFRAVLPVWYDMYRKAFDASIWFADDPGPFLGRTIVYKLQGRLHKDKHDVGPLVLFPVGQFTGDEMIFPQLKTKLQYTFTLHQLQSLIYIL